MRVLTLEDMSSQPRTAAVQRTLSLTNKESITVHGTIVFQQYMAIVPVSPINIVANLAVSTKSYSLAIQTQLDMLAYSAMGSLVIQFRRSSPYHYQLDTKPCR